MSLQTIWKGTLLVKQHQVPVRLHSAAVDQTVHFRMLHKKDRQPVEQKMVTPEDGEEVGREDMRKGAEIENGTFVILNEDELEELEPASSREIHVEQFVPRPELKHMWYDRPYFLSPDGDRESYFALVKLLENSEDEGIAQLVMRKKEYVGALHVYRGCLVLVTLRFAGEVVTPDEIHVSFDNDLDPTEVRMAEQLIGMFETEFDPSAYKDDYHDRLLRLIEAKAKGTKVKVQKPQSGKQSSSLTDALQKSIANAKKDKKKQ